MDTEIKNARGLLTEALDAIRSITHARYQTCPVGLRNELHTRHADADYMIRKAIDHVDALSVCIEELCATPPAPAEEAGQVRVELPAEDGKTVPVIVPRKIWDSVRPRTDLTAETIATVDQDGRGLTTRYTRAGLALRQREPDGSTEFTDYGIAVARAQALALDFAERYYIYRGPQPHIITVGKYERTDPGIQLLATVIP